MATKKYTLIDKSHHLLMVTDLLHYRAADRKGGGTTEAIYPGDLPC